MSGHPVLSGVEAAAQRLAQEMARALPVTVVSVALWDRPSFALTVRAVGAVRDLPLAVGARLPLSAAPWHRAVFERQEPVFLEPGCPEQEMSGEALGLALAPAPRSVYLLPLRVGDETIGVVALGEMRSPDREPFPEEKRRRCLTLLHEWLAGSGHVWEAGRLRRQVRAMSSLVPVVRQMLAMGSHADVLGCLVSRVADWLGVHVRGILLQVGASGRLTVAARCHVPGGAADGEVDQLLLAVTRAEPAREGPVSVVRMVDDPLDPLNGERAMGEGWTRVTLPLLQGDRLLGLACLYVEDDLYLASWEREVFGWLAETAALGMGLVSTREAIRAPTCRRCGRWPPPTAARWTARDRTRGRGDAPPALPAASRVARPPGSSAHAELEDDRETDVPTTTTS